MSQIETLQAEIAALRAELDTLKTALTDGTISLHCAQLKVGDARYNATISITDDGPQLHLADAKVEAPLCALTATEEGATLALSGRDGIPRAVVTARPEGGGVSLLDGQTNIGADLWGSNEASWLLLNHAGQPAMLALGTGAGGSVEAYDETSTLSAALPNSEREVFVPPDDDETP